MRPWLSGITGPCQGSVGVSITPGRTKHPERGFCVPGERCLRTFWGNRNRRKHGARSVASTPAEA